MDESGEIAEELNEESFCYYSLKSCNLLNPGNRSPDKENLELTDDNIGP